MIRKEGKEIIRVERSGRFRLVVFEDDTKIRVGLVGKIERICIDCQKIVRRGFSESYIHEEYLCQSCNKKSTRNPFYGKRHSQEAKAVMSEKKLGLYDGEKNPFYGKKHSHETLEKLRGDSRLSHPGKKNPFYGKKHSEESKKKIIDKNRTFRESLSNEDKLKIRAKQSMSHKRFIKENPSYTKKIKRSAAYASHQSQSRYKKNKIEQMFHDMMIEHNIDVKYSLILNCYQYDFGHKDSKTLFEINGDYWHANSLFYGDRKDLKTLNETQKNKVARDKEKLAWAESKGFSVVTIWEYDLYNNPEKVLREAKDAVKI